MKKVQFIAPALLILGLACSYWLIRRAADTSGDSVDLARDLVGHWKLRGDCRDHSGHAHDGTNHGVDLETSAFDGRGAYIEIPPSDALRLGRGDFSLSAWVYTDRVVDDTLGDVLSWYDPELRRGLTLGLQSGAGGYQSTGDDRHVFFGIDDATLSDWKDCGRPSPTSNYVSNSLTVHDGHLYAGIIDGWMGGGSSTILGGTFEDLGLFRAGPGAPIA